MNPWINYHHLYYFMTIAEVGSVSKASEILRLGQPTLSSQLKVFEEALGVTLFERSHKKLKLTEQGQLALDYARNIFRLGGEMYEAIHDRLKPTKISLTLGALDGVPKSIMMKIAKDAYDFQDCSIQFREGRFDQLMVELKAHRIDLVVSNFLPSTESAQGFYHKKILKSPISIFGASKFKNLKNKFPQSLKGKPFIIPTFDTQLRYEMESWLKMNNINVDIIAEAQDSSLKKMMAVDGLALIPSSHYAVSALLEEKKLYEIGKLENVFDEFYLISSERKIENPIGSFLMKNFKL